MNNINQFKADSLTKECLNHFTKEELNLLGTVTKQVSHYSSLYRSL